MGRGLSCGTPCCRQSRWSLEEALLLHSTVRTAQPSYAASSSSILRILQFGIDRKSTRVLTHVGNGNVRASLQMMQATGSVATNFLKSNMVQYQPRVSGYWNTLKVYFTVSEGGGVRRPSYLSCRVYTSTPTAMYVKLGETLGWHHGRRYMWASKPYTC